MLKRAYADNVARSCVYCGKVVQGTALTLGDHFLVEHSNAW